MDEEYYYYYERDDWEDDYPEEYDDYQEDDYYQTWGWRYQLRNLHYRLYWWLRRHIQRCDKCKKRLANCECIPF